MTGDKVTLIVFVRDDDPLGAGCVMRKRWEPCSANRRLRFLLRRTNAARILSNPQSP
jgi:hypothetical protein